MWPLKCEKNIRKLALLHMRDIVPIVMRVLGAQAGICDKPNIDRDGFRKAKETESNHCGIALWSLKKQSRYRICLGVQRMSTGEQ